MSNKKHCPICAFDVDRLAKPLESHVCKNRDGTEVKENRACHECWEVHFSTKIEEPHYDCGGIKCIFCDVLVDPSDFDTLGARKDTMTRWRCKKAARDLPVGSYARCQARCRGPLAWQPYDRQIHGRIFTCNGCGFQTCMDCDRPEHPGQSCTAAQTQFDVANPELKQAEDKTAKERAKEKYKVCPQCDSPFQTAKPCGYVQCTACGHRFCEHCMINWVGEDSQYSGGKAQHGVYKAGKNVGLPCKYVSHDSEHGLKHRPGVVTARERSKRKSQEGGDPAPKKQKKAAQLKSA